MMINLVLELVLCILPIEWVRPTRRMSRDVDFLLHMNQTYISSNQRILPSSVYVYLSCYMVIRADDRLHTTVHGRRMSISISRQTYLHVLKEDVIVPGDGSTRRMEEVLRCINWDTGVMSRELP